MGSVPRAPAHVSSRGFIPSVSPLMLLSLLKFLSLPFQLGQYLPGFSPHHRVERNKVCSSDLPWNRAVGECPEALLSPRAPASVLGLRLPAPLCAWPQPPGLSAHSYSTVSNPVSSPSTVQSQALLLISVLGTETYPLPSFLPSSNFG